MSLSAQAQSAGPFLWNSYVDVVGNYTRIDSESPVVSRFTPGVAVTVTRVQLQAALGSLIFPNTKCSPLPRIGVTDGTTEFSIAIPNARQTGGFPKSVHNDSGPIAVSFPANAELVVKVLPGQKGCDPGSININVQYSVN